MRIATIDPVTNKLTILGRSVRFWVVVIALVVIAMTLLTTLLTTALVRITYTFADYNEQDSTVLRITNASGEVSDISTFFGDYALIPRDTIAIAARSTSMETQAAITGLPLFSIPHYELTLWPQQLVSKIGAETLGCNLINPAGTFSYECGSLASAVKINRPNSGQWTTTDQPVGGFAAFARYKNGFLGLEQPITGEPLTINYVAPGGDAQRVRLPGDLQATSSDNVAVITDQSNSATDTFVVANLTTGKYLVVPSLGNTASATVLSRAAETDTRFNISTCTMNASTLVCYHGPNPIDHHNTESHTEYREEHTEGHIEIQSLQGTKPAEVYELHEFPGAHTIHITSQGDILLHSEQVLYAVTTSDSTATVHSVSWDVANVGAHGASLFYSARDGLYEYIPGDHRAYLRFFSYRLGSLTLSTYGDDVLINGFVKANTDNELRNIAHAYKLTDTNLAQAQKHKEDILPYEFTGQITYMDYDDNRIYVGINPIFSTNPQTGARRIDQTATKQQEQTVRQRLANDGMLGDNTRVLFRW